MGSGAADNLPALCHPLRPRDSSECRTRARTRPTLTHPGSLHYCRAPDTALHRTVPRGTRAADPQRTKLSLIFDTGLRRAGFSLLPPALAVRRLRASGRVGVAATRGPEWVRILPAKHPQLLGAVRYARRNEKESS